MRTLPNGLKRVLCVVLWMIAPALTRAQTGELPVARWEPAIQRFEAADRSSAPPLGGVVFVGSSSIRLWSTLSEDFPSSKVINRGFGGSELSDAIAYVERIVLPYQPQVVVLYAGDNDLAGGKTAEQVFGDYRSFVLRVQQAQPKTRIIFVSIKPSPSRSSLLEANAQANRLVREYAERHPTLDYVDVASPMLDREGQPRPELFVDDGLHMNAQGYALWREALAPLLLAP